MSDEPSADDEPVVVFEFAIPADALALASPLREFPDVIVEYEQLVPTNHTPLPYVWATDGDEPQFREAVEADSSVDHLRQLATFDEGALYEVEWAPDTGRILHRIADTTNEVTLLQAEGHDTEWTLKLRFSSRDRLTTFQDFIDEQGIAMRVIRLYDLTTPKMGQYNITEKQREALLQALEMGHFEIPREATMDDLADSLGISPRAVSERLRRGQTNLISNSLSIGRPTGVGLDEE